MVKRAGGFLWDSFITKGYNLHDITPLVLKLSPRLLIFLIARISPINLCQQFLYDGPERRPRVVRERVSSTARVVMITVAF